jgi:hypothetical protein
MAFGKRGAIQEAPGAVAVEAEESCDVLNLVRLTMHPSIRPLMERKTALQERKTNLLQGQRQLTAVLEDFQKVHSLDLAEEAPEAMRKWREVKQQLADYEDQIGLVERGLSELDEQIDAGMGAVREAVQAELDALFLEPVQTTVEALQVLSDTNARLHELERCSNKLLQTGRLELFNPGLEGWLFRLERKLALLVPK